MKQFVKARCRHTNPTEKELILRQNSTVNLVSEFAPHAKLAQMIDKKLDEIGAPEEMKLGFDNAGRGNKVQNWVRYGVIPYHYVVVLCEIDAVKRAGFTIKNLRPDVKPEHLVW